MVKPDAKSIETAQKEIEEAMSIGKEAHAAIDLVIRMLTIPFGGASSYYSESGYLKHQKHTKIEDNDRQRQQNYSLV